MTISEFFVEVQNLNTYAQLDDETLPTFLEPELTQSNGIHRILAADQHI